MPSTALKNKSDALFDRDKRNAYESIVYAQFLAFAPYLFQTAVILRDKGILQAMENNRRDGMTIETVSALSGLSHYAARVLLEGGLGAGLLYRKGDAYFSTKAGYYFLTNPMTRINTDFMRDVCYAGAADLQTALEEGRPAGLHHLGDWNTIYEGLSILPQPAHDSWFSFDHFYSDTAFPEALPIVFENNPAKIMDIGANTGRFSLACLNYNQEVEMGLVDLEIQLNVARRELNAAGFEGRYETFAINLLDETRALPTGYDIIWMSQFLSCFSDDQIVSILQRCADAMDQNSRVLINETFWDHQHNEAAAMSLQMTSLYFTAMANGNSQMYDSEVFKGFIEQAGLTLEHEYRNIGQNHTVWSLRKK